MPVSTVFISLTRRSTRRKNCLGLLAEFHLQREKVQCQPLRFLRSKMLHELALGLAGRIRALNDLDGDALAVGDQEDPDLSGLPQRFWVGLATIKTCFTNRYVLRLPRGGSLTCLRTREWRVQSFIYIYHTYSDRALPKPKGWVGGKRRKTRRPFKLWPTPNLCSLSVHLLCTSSSRCPACAGLITSTVDTSPRVSSPGASPRNS